MIVQLTVLCLLNILSAEDVLSSRAYFPEEEDMFRIKTLIVDDGDGNYHEEDLTIQPNSSYKVLDSDVNFYLYTKYNYAPDIIPANGLADLKMSHFKSTRKNVFIIHGWTCDYNSHINVQIKRSIIRMEDVNIFVVDWSGPASGLYVKAKAAVPDVGKIVGKFINNIILTYNVPTSQFYLIGHSLGAHIAGCAGAAVNGLVHSIVGLDPAGPLFTFSNTENRVDPTDGDFVHIIHTNSRTLGFGSAIGHVDYYPDGGAVQNDCGKDIFGTCSHSKSYEYYALSITGTAYNSTMCGSYKKYLKGECEQYPYSLMGMFDVDKSATGDYYLTVSGCSAVISSLTLVAVMLLLII